MLAESKQRMADALRQIKAKEDALQRAVEKHHGGQIDQLAEAKRREHIVNSELRDGGEDGEIPTEKEVELRRFERIVAAREKKAREVQAELLAKERSLVAKQDDMDAMESELQGLLHLAESDNSLVQDILRREVAVARREGEAEKLLAHLGHFSAREAAAHELEDRFMVRTYENNMRAKDSREMLVSAAHTRDAVCKKWEHYDKYLQQDKAISSTIADLQEGRTSYVRGNYARQQDKERASPKAKGRALKLPPAAADGSSPQAADPLNKSLEDTASRQEGGSEHSTMPLPAAAAGFHIDGELDELEHKIYALTHCISMLATN
eukprot:TRINITY_DN7894_c0_g1_i2.p1 TRINITY_DN7894_c0_g1~~TRINITY_DN7894_c0_g1_i2.p1  ORF type:complete len:322 (-),score=111.80 TRINITY_DN7894_c0_g1_i2:248-1213(-)